MLTRWVKPLKRQSLGYTHAVGMTAQKSISLTDDYGPDTMARANRALSGSGIVFAYYCESCLAVRGGIGQAGS